MESKNYWKTPFKLLLVCAALSQASARAEMQNLSVFHGFVTKIRCDGRILAKSGGSDQLLQVEPLPQALGCGVFVRPLSKSGSTNLILETSAGTIHRIISIIDTQGRVPKESELVVSARAME